MKQIILVRHSEVSIDVNKKITSLEFGKWVNDYNNSKIKVPKEIESELKILFDKSDIILSSQLIRTKETIKIFDKEIFEEDSIFNEFEIPYYKFKLIKFRPKIWLVIYRLLWVLGFSKYSESYKEANDRVKLSVDRLTMLSNQYNAVVLVGSGLINRFIYNELLKRDWNIVEKLSNKNLGYSILEKN